MKKCKHCEGKGYKANVDKATFCEMEVSKNTGLRVQCKECLGKGKK